MISLRFSPPSTRQEMLNRLPVGDSIRKSTRSSIFNRRRHLFSPRSVADLDTTAQVVTCCCQDCSPIGRRVVDAKKFFLHEQLATSRRLIFCSRRFNMSSWLACSLPLGADSLPTTFQLHTTTHDARKLIGYRFQTAHVSMPTFPIQKTRHDFFRLREKIVAGFSNLPRAPHHTRLQKTVQDSPRPCQNYT